MSPLIWLAVAVAAGVGAYVVGWPAWRSYRSRDAHDANAERYLAWRGRAVRGQPSRPTEGMTRDERRGVYLGAFLAMVAMVALIAFFTTS